MRRIFFIVLMFLTTTIVNAGEDKRTVIERLDRNAQLIEKTGSDVSKSKLLEELRQDIQTLETEKNNLVGREIDIFIHAGEILENAKQAQEVVAVVEQNIRELYTEPDKDLELSKLNGFVQNLEVFAPILNEGQKYVLYMAKTILYNNRPGRDKKGVYSEEKLKKELLEYLKNKRNDRDRKYSNELNSLVDEILDKARYYLQNSKLLSSDITVLMDILPYYVQELEMAISKNNTPEFERLMKGALEIQTMVLNGIETKGKNNESTTYNVDTYENFYDFMQYNGRLLETIKETQLGESDMMDIREKQALDILTKSDIIKAFRIK